MRNILLSITSAMLSVLTFILSLFGIPFGRDNMNVDYNRVSSIVFTSTPVKLNMGTSIYRTMQGGCTDGKYAYYILLDTRNDKSYATIAKYNLENWECVFSKSKLALDHGNDMTYNPKIKKLVVVHNAPNRKWISIVNPDSLEIEKTVEIKENVYSISYNQKRNQYIIGVAFTYDYAILDEDFNTVKYFKGVESKSTKQGMDSDDNYVYFILSGPNILAVYDWDGKFYGWYPLKGITSAYETENIFHKDGVFYIGYNESRGQVYKTDMTVIYK